jgi:hypothetical protein
MPRAIQHHTILNVPSLDLVLYPGEAISITSAQADELAILGATILPDEPMPTTSITRSADDSLDL